MMLLTRHDLLLSLFGIGSEETLGVEVCILFPDVSSLVVLGSETDVSCSSPPRSAHPSPLSAHRGFLGNGHFKRADEWLRGNDRDAIDWTLLGISMTPAAAPSSSKSA